MDWAFFKRMARRRDLAGPALAAALIAGAMACAPERTPRSVEAGGDAAEQEINLELWLERLEVGSRELYSAREAVVAAIGLEAGDVIADIGAGTGLYALLFAPAVAPGGHVFAEDIEPLFLDLIARRAGEAGHNNVTAVYGREDDVTLPAGAIDVAFIADTYHYFDDRESVMRSVARALKPGGELVLIDYDLPENGARPEGKAHVRFGRDAVISEIEFVGFEFVGAESVAGLSDNFFLRFRKP